MAEVILKSVGKVYPGGVRAVQGVDLHVRHGEFIVLVGPSGCRKSTTLRMVAGLEEISEGTVSIGGRVVNDVAPSERDIAMVFQNYALYPHMTVLRNMAFGLERRRTRSVARLHRTPELLDPGGRRRGRRLGLGGRLRLAGRRVRHAKVHVRLRRPRRLRQRRGHRRLQRPDGLVSQPLPSIDIGVECRHRRRARLRTRLHRLQHAAEVLRSNRRRRLRDALGPGRAAGKREHAHDRDGGRAPGNGPCGTMDRSASHHGFSFARLRRNASLDTMSATSSANDPCTRARDASASSSASSASAVPRPRA